MPFLLSLQEVWIVTLLVPKIKILGFFRGKINRIIAKGGREGKVGSANLLKIQGVGYVRRFCSSRHNDPRASNKVSFHPSLESFTSSRGYYKCEADNIETFIPWWIKRDIIREILVPQPLYFSRMFSVLKKNGKVRPIIDLSALNKMLCIPSFRMETVDSI